MVQEKLGQADGETEEDSEDEPDRTENGGIADETDVEHTDDEGNWSEDVGDATREGEEDTRDSNALRTSECLSLRARGIELPNESKERTAILDRLKEVVEETLAEEYGIESKTITGRPGHEYAQIPVVCPECDEPLDTGEVFTGDTNEAYALAECGNCSYTGGVTFRAIDLKNDDEDAPHQSAVRIGDRTPTYVGYGG